MAAPFELNTTSTSNPNSYGGAISGATAFNIAGINLGTQYPTAVSASGASATPADSFASATSKDGVFKIAAAVAAVLLLGVVIWKLRS